MLSFESHWPQLSVPPRTGLGFAAAGEPEGAFELVGKQAARLTAAVTASSERTGSPRLW